ncbi:translation initiation factor IF-2-like [Leopardus geoffroyi]|uniref:translation initiation factor IF-2-like n=1 Tax=Leopardus geoffroyi TaxID=46844 RepID=UPI001E25F98A|nr:translation initiation factor IF-2-like [Leopardus geoffroyi]
MAPAPPWPGAHRRGAGAGGSTGSRAAAPAALQRRGCLRSAPLPPPLSIPPRGSLRRRRRRRLAPPPRLGWRRRRGGGGPGIGCAWRLPAPALDPAAARPAHLAALPSAGPAPGARAGAPRRLPAGLAPLGVPETRGTPASGLREPGREPRSWRMDFEGRGWGCPGRKAGRCNKARVEGRGRQIPQTLVFFPGRQLARERERERDRIRPPLLCASCALFSAPKQIAKCLRVSWALAGNSRMAVGSLNGH